MNASILNLDKPKETNGTCLAAIIALPVVVALTAIIRGFTLRALWSWFVVPAFHITALTIPTALGLSLIVGMFSKYDSKYDKSSDDDGKYLAVERLFHDLLKTLAACSLSILFGRIYLLFQ